MDTIKRFPRRLPPQNIDVETDSHGKFSYDELYSRLQDLKLSVYLPSDYLLDRSVLDREKEQWNYDQGDRERALVGMMRVNLLKRLESSVHAFRLTTRRILDKILDILEAIQKYREKGLDEVLTPFPSDDEDDEEFLIGAKRQYNLADLDIKTWESELLDDKKVFATLLNKAEQVTVERDKKLSELKVKLQEKSDRASSNEKEYSNRKVIVFTTFADTAHYLYENLETWVLETLDLNIALVTGSEINRSTTNTSQFRRILEQFAPLGQEVTQSDNEIDILIATDCLSEGQNLQDCDLVVNYDIHWNPVRLMQRFGRIDRLGSQNTTVSMINFWPTKDLEAYLNLKYRVEARAALADACATGLEDPLNTEYDTKIASEIDLSFRDLQLAKMRDEILDIEDVEENISISDLTLDDFVEELLQYIRQNQKALENAPQGIFAVVDNTDTSRSEHEFSPVSQGTIFCLRNTKLELPQKRAPTRSVLFNIRLRRWQSFFVDPSS